MFSCNAEGAVEGLGGEDGVCVSERAGSSGLEYGFKSPKNRDRESG